MDSVIYRQPDPAGVADFIQWLHDGDQVPVPDNNSGYTPGAAESWPDGAGRAGALLPVRWHRCIPAGSGAGCSVFAIGEAGLLNALYDAGITMNRTMWWWVRAVPILWTPCPGGEPEAHRREFDVSGPIENSIAPPCRAGRPLRWPRGSRRTLRQAQPLMMRTGADAAAIRRRGDGGRPQDTDAPGWRAVCPGAGAVRCVTRQTVEICLSAQRDIGRRRRHAALALAFYSFSSSRVYVSPST